MSTEKMRGIIYQAWSINTMLAGTKTQTHRLSDLQVVNADAERWSPAKNYGWQVEERTEWVNSKTEEWMLLECPWRVGDQVYAKETWRVGAWREDQRVAIDYRADGYSRQEWLICEDEKLFERLYCQSYKDAEKSNFEPNKDGRYRWEPGQSPCRWRSPLFMPRWAARPELTQPITGIRCERVQKISEEDCVAEGWPRHRELYPYINREDKTKLWFRQTWNSIHATPKPVRANSKWAKALGWTGEGVVGYVSLPFSTGDGNLGTEVRNKPHFRCVNPYSWILEFDSHEILEVR